MIIVFASVYVVVEAIIFVRELQDIKVSEAKAKVTFECEISKSGLSVEWYKGDKKLRRDEKYDIQKDDKVHRLIIDEVVDKDVGEYKAVYKQLSTSAKLTLAGREH